MTQITVAIVLLLAVCGFFLSRSRAVRLVSGELRLLHSSPSYCGLYTALWILIMGFGSMLVTLSGLNIHSSQELQYTTSQLISASEISSLDQREISVHVDRIISDARKIAYGQMPLINDDTRVVVAEKINSLDKFTSRLIIYISFGMGVAAGIVTYFQISKTWRARNRVERIMRIAFGLCALIAILTTIGIVLSLIGETVGFFSDIPFYKFFGTHWSPLSGVFEGKIDPDTVGAIPLFAGTLLITAIAMLVAIPVGLVSAIYLSEYASAHIRRVIKPLLELLAGIPTVVYGFFAAITVAPFIRQTGEFFGLDVASESALAAGVVMGIMIIPFISSLSDDIINSVPNSLREGSYGLGATQSETIMRVILPSAMPGIVSAILLGVSRAIGETMIVVMAAGQGANLTANPLEAVTTVTVQIVALITGDTEAATAAGPAFALGFVLFSVTLLLNFYALHTVRKYQQKYD